MKRLNEGNFPATKRPRVETDNDKKRLLEIDSLNNNSSISVLKSYVNLLDIIKKLRNNVEESNRKATPDIPKIPERYINNFLMGEMPLEQIISSEEQLQAIKISYPEEICTLVGREESFINKGIGKAFKRLLLENYTVKYFEDDDNASARLDCVIDKIKEPITTIFDLPNEIRNKIFSSIDGELQRVQDVRFVCKRFYNDFEIIRNYTVRKLNFEFIKDKNLITDVCSYYQELNIDSVKLKIDGLKRTPELFELFIESLSKNKRIIKIELDISKNDIDGNWVEKFAPYLIKINLTSLDISGNKIGCKGVEIIAKNLLNLTSLNIAENKIGCKGVEIIAKNLLNLTSLNIAENKIGCKGVEIIAKNLLNLTSLNIAENDIEDISEPEVKSLGENLKNLTSLTIVDPYFNNICGKDIYKNLPNLTLLTIGGLSNVELQDIVKNMGKLTELNIIDALDEDISSSDSNIELIKAIATNIPALTKFTLELHFIGDTGLKIIATEMKNLTSLTLRYCHISAVGLEIIVENMPKLTSLRIEDDLSGYPEMQDIQIQMQGGKRFIDQLLNRGVKVLIKW